MNFTKRQPFGPVKLRRSRECLQLCDLRENVMMLCGAASSARLLTWTVFVYNLYHDITLADLGNIAGNPACIAYPTSEDKGQKRKGHLNSSLL